MTKHQDRIDRILDLCDNGTQRSSETGYPESRWRTSVDAIRQQIVTLSPLGSDQSIPLEAGWNTITVYRDGDAVAVGVLHADPEE